jgi:uncharacterized protein (DUF2062 family)/trans-aconitate methyltransferase
MQKPPGRLAAAVYRYRTEHDTPVRQALAVGLGLYIGASPFVGVHLTLSLALGWLFGLNRFRVYIAANISNPLVAPFLYAMEIQVGSWLRTGQMYSAARLAEIRLQGLAIDILIGSVVVGSILAVTGTLLTFWGSRARRSPDEVRLVAAAAERYLSAGIATWEFARGKLLHDPMYLQVLKDGRVPRRGRLLDLGCGQGLMLALLATASDEWRQGRWPASWPPPPDALDLFGIDSRPRVAKRARDVLGDAATISELDLASWSPPPCDAVLLFDVLHLLPRDAQDRLIDGVARAMSPGGVLIVREADAEAGWKFHMVRVGNRFNAFWQGRFRRPFCFDSVSGWTRRFREAGFDVEAVTRQDSGLFGNVLVQARLVRGSAGQTG